MRRLICFLVLLSACSHGTAGLRGDAGVDSATPIDSAVLDSAVLDSAVLDSAVLDSAVLDSAVLDSAVLDSAVLDSAVLDASVPCEPHTFQSSNPSTEVGLFMSSGTLHGWWFQITRPFRPSTLGTEVLAPEGASLVLALVPVAGPGAFPSDSTPTGAVLSATVTAPAWAIAADVTAPATSTAPLPPGWYVLGTRLLTGVDVRRAGGSATGQTFRMTGGSGSMPSGTRRVFVSGCLEPAP